MSVPSQDNITRSINGGQALAEMLQLHEVDLMLGMGGFQLLPFYEAVRSLGLNHNLINDERCGAFAADAYAKSGKVDSKMLEATLEVNESQPMIVVEMAKERLGILKGKRIAVLGLAFKPETDDIRDSVGIGLAKRLLKLGAKITIHDPKALENARKIFHDNVKYVKSIPSALKDCQCAIIMTQWKDYETINNKTINLMAKKLIIDSRRILSNKNLNAKYYAIGLGQKV